MEVRAWLFLSNTFTPVCTICRFIRCKGRMTGTADVHELFPGNLDMCQRSSQMGSCLPENA